MEFLLHLWDELDDVAGVCRHVATAAAAEVMGSAGPLIATASAIVLAGAATRLVAPRQLLTFLS